MAGFGADFGLCVRYEDFDVFEEHVHILTAVQLQGEVTFESAGVVF